MTITLAVELNDAGLQLARATETGAAELVGDDSPGFALLQDGRVLVGAAAAQRASHGAAVRAEPLLA